MLVSKVGRVGLAVGWQWQQRIGLNWGGRAGKSGKSGMVAHWSPNQTHTAQIFSLLPSGTSLTSNWEPINVRLIQDSWQRKAIIAILLLPLGVLWTDGVCLKLRQFDA